MFQCCSSKEATSAVNIKKLNIQAFYIYALGILSPKKDHIIAVVMNISMRLLFEVLFDVVGGSLTTSMLITDVHDFYLLHFCLSENF